MKLLLSIQLSKSFCVSVLTYLFSQRPNCVTRPGFVRNISIHAAVDLAARTPWRINCASIGMIGRFLALAASFLIAPCWGAPAASAQAGQIVQRSVQNTNADWDAAPQYNFTERDIITKGDERTEKTFQVVMIDGSPYNKLIATHGHPLSSQQAADEDRKLQREAVRRRRESPPERQKRISEYQRERRQD